MTRGGPEPVPAGAVLDRRPGDDRIGRGVDLRPSPGDRSDETAPANTLMDIRRQFAACMAGKSLGPAGSQLTIMLMMKRDGSIFGKPRITFSHLEGDEDAKQRFVDDAERAINACLPFRVTS